MISEKERSAERMLDAIGGISDVFLTEADEYVAARHGYSLMRRFKLALVCFALALFVTSASIAGVLIYNGLGEKPHAHENIYADGDGETVGTPTLSSAMLALKDTTEALRTDADTVELFDGSSRVIWKYSDEDDYRVCVIPDTYASAISSSLKHRENFSEISPSAESDGELEGLWICFGDGLVYSPCLKESNGNIGFGKVFDYAPELEPSKGFSELISNAVIAQQ